MTSEKYDKLTDEEKLVLIARLAGVPNPQAMHGYIPRGSYAHHVVSKPEAHSLVPIPDYLHDLNAMYEAVHRMPEDDLEDRLSLFGRTLYEVVFGKKLFDYMLDLSDAIDHCHKLIEATAAQRAKAFALTMTKGDK